MDHHTTIKSYAGVDWQLIALQIKRQLGWSNAKLAKAVDLSEAQIHNITSGRAPEPRFTPANLLLDLWADTRWKDG